MSLTQMGWSSRFSTQKTDTSTIARIIAVHRSHMRAIREQGELNLYLPGNTETMPTVGDWVTITPEFEDEQGEPAAIVQKVLDRKSYLARWTPNGKQVMAANVDTVFIVTSANEDFSVNRLQRYLLLCQEGGCTPAIVVSKTDLHEDPGSMLEDLKKNLGTPVIGTTLTTGEGVNQIKALMPEGSTSVFVGSSGVGKSSLVNTLLGESVQIVQDIREDDGKGRHTTTSRHLFQVPGHGLIIDTPGLREVQVFGSDEAIGETFPRIAALAEQCRFADCSHGTEPGCAIKKALESGDLEASEWENFTKLQKEAAYVRRKEDKAEMANSKKRWKDINVMMRKKKKFEDGLE